MAAPTLALDAPRTVSRRVGAWRAFALLAFMLTIAAAVWWAPVQLMAIPAVGLLHAAMGALISAITALLMVDYSRTTGRRGFLVIAVTYLMLAVLLGVFPLTFPDVLLDDRALIGSVQTPVGLFFGWHFAVPWV